MIKTVLTSIAGTIKVNLKEQGFTASLLTVIFYTYGLISTPVFWVLIALSFLDYLTAIYAAYKRKKLNWNICLDGIVKKVFIGILIVISALVDFTLNFFGINTMGIFHNFVMAMLIGRELGSIIENMEKGKVWVPAIFKEVVERLKNINKGNNIGG